MAKQVLSQSILKRSKTSQREVDLYADMMRDGRWEPMKQDLPVTIQNTGQLADGYHRMNAVVQVGRPVEIVVKDTRPKADRWPGVTVEPHEFYRPGKALIPSAKSKDRGGAGVAGRETAIPACPICWWTGGDVPTHIRRVHKEAETLGAVT